MTAVLAAGAGLDGVAIAAQLDDTWTGPATGNWSTPANWSLGVYPDNGADTYRAFIDSNGGQATTVTLDVNAIIDAGAVDIDDQLVIGNGNALTVVQSVGGGTIANSGVISIGGSSAQLLTANDVTLSGAGVIQLFGSSINDSFLAGATATGSINNLGNTIHGTGSIASSGTLTFTNAGEIRANAGESLAIAYTGTVTVNNAGGLVSAHDGGQILVLGHGSIVGGSLATTNGGAITLQAGVGESATIDGVANSGVVTVSNGNSGTIQNAIANTGAIRIGGSGGVLYVDGAVTLSGSGNVQLFGNNPLDAFVTNAAAGGSLDNSNTISGTGSIVEGVNPFVVNNTGSIMPDTGDTLHIGGSGVVAINNAGGIVGALNTGKLAIQGGGSVVGGSVTTAFGGTVALEGSPGSAAVLDAVSNNGLVAVTNGKEGTLRGSIANAGSIAVGGNSGKLFIDGSVTLSDGGDVQLFGTVPTDSFLSNASGGGTLTSDNTISGTGSIVAGVNPFTINNTGSIQAGAAENLRIGGSGVITVNNALGILNASNGGVLQIEGNVEVIGGSITSSFGGVVALEGSPGSPAVVDGVNNSAQLTVTNGMQGTLKNAITNNGSIKIGGSGAALIVDGAVALSGSGEVRFFGANASDSFLSNASAGGSLANGNTISGSGSIVGGLLPFNLTNSGTIEARAGDSLQIGGSGTVTVDNSAGIIQALNGGTITIADGAQITGGTLQSFGSGAIIGNTGIGSATLDNVTNGAGTLTVQAGSTVNIVGTLTNHATIDIQGQLTGGNLTSDGVIQINGGALDAAMTQIDPLGTLSGNGTVSGTFINLGVVTGPSGPPDVLEFTGTVKGDGDFLGQILISGTFEPGNSPATVDMEDLALASTANTVIELGGLIPGSEYDVINATGLVELDGTLTVSLINGFMPNLGDTFDVINFGSRLGDFATYSGLNIGAGLMLTPTFQAGGLQLVTTMAVPEPGAGALASMAAAAAAGAWMRRRRGSIARRS